MDGKSKLIRLNRILNMGIVLTTIALIFSVGLLYSWGDEKAQRLEEQEELYNAVADTLKHYKGVDGENRARITQLQTARISDFLRHQSDKEDIRRLQEKVKKYEKDLKRGGSVTVAEITSEYKTTEATERVVYEKDSVYPTYYANSGNKFGEWAYISSVSNKDSTTYDLKINNRITLVLGRDKTGFLGLGKGRPFADITDDNPYSKYKSLRSYEVNDTYRRWRLGLGFTFGATYLQGQIGLGGTAGITIQYR